MGKNVVMTTSTIFGSSPKPIHSTSRGAMAIVGIVCVTTSSGKTAFSSVRKRSIRKASPKASSVPIARPAAASSREISACRMRFGKSETKAFPTSSGEGSM